MAGYHDTERVIHYQHQRTRFCCRFDNSTNENKSWQVNFNKRNNTQINKPIHYDKCL